MAASALGKGIAGNMFRSLANIDVTTVQGAQDAEAFGRMLDKLLARHAA